MTSVHHLQNFKYFIRIYRWRICKPYYFHSRWYA